jgi:hypothetical protein
MMREGLQLGRSLCLLKVLRFGLSSAEPKLVLAELLLGGVAANKSAQKELKELKVTAVGLGGVEKAVDEAWRACLGWWPGAETGFVRCRNVRNKRSKRTKSSGRLAMPWMIRRRGCLPLCFVKVLKCGLVLAESTLVLAGPSLGGFGAKKRALKELKVTAVLLAGLKGCPENMLDKRGMRDKGCPEMRA